MARTDLIALAEEFEEKARALRLAHELMTTHGIATAKKNLPATLRAATKIRGGSSAPLHLSTTQQMIDLLAAHPAGLLYREFTERGIDPTGALTNLHQRGIITKTPTQHQGREVFRYALTESGRARASTNGNGNGNGHHPEAATPERRLVKGHLTAFLLSAAQEKPQTVIDLVAALRAVQHPIKNGGGIAGPLAQMTHRGILARGENGTYRITAKGRQHLAQLQQADAQAALA